MEACVCGTRKCSFRWRIRPVARAGGLSAKPWRSVAGAEQKAHFLCMDLPHSDDSFVVAFPAENTESFLEGHNRAFAHFGGVPNTILYDNTRIAVAKITGDGERKPTNAFSGLQSHYLFAAKFGRPGKGNDKGNVEGLVGYARRNFMVPVPRVASWEVLNQHLLEQCIQRRAKKVHGETETIAERFARDKEKLLALPATPHRACDKRTTQSQFAGAWCAMRPTTTRCQWEAYAAIGKYW